MTGKALGILEIGSIARGVVVADVVTKTAAVELIKVAPACPGKFIVIFGGEIGPVSAALAAGKAAGKGDVLGTFLAGNLHAGIFPALAGAVAPPAAGALGVIETYTAAAAINAADAAAKAADVQIVDIRLAYGLAGKAYVLMTGEVAGVQMAVAAAEKHVAEEGPVVGTAVISAPYKELWQKLL